MKIPDSVQQLTNEPVDSKFWHSGDGEEYQNIFLESEWLIQNLKAGTSRIRSVFHLEYEVTIRQ